VAEKRPQHVAERRVGELRQSARERQEVLQVRPHELRREHAVRRRAARERPAQVLAVVLPGAQDRIRRRRGRLVGRQQHRQVQVVRTAQVIAGSSRRARLDARLEVLLRHARDAELRERPAEQRAPAARRRAHDVAPLRDDQVDHVGGD
jgi:hypothetical protein